MRNPVSRIACWNRRAADRASTTHRNEREVRSNLLIEIGYVLGYSRGRFLRSIIAVEWPDAGGQIPNTADATVRNNFNLTLLPRAFARRTSSVSRRDTGACSVIALADVAAVRARRTNHCPGQNADLPPAGSN